jgi:hypothetical protein
MSEERGAPPASIAEALYPGGPIDGGPSNPRTREVIESGFAKSDPRFADERPPTRHEGGPLPHAPKARTGPAFDAARVQARDQYDPGLMGEFGTAAREFGLDQRGGERLLEMHSRASKAAEEHYARSLAEGVDSLQRELHPEHLTAARELINDERYTPREMREWLQTWGNHPAVARMLTNWAAAIRSSRRY